MRSATRIDTKVGRYVPENLNEVLTLMTLCSNQARELFIAVVQGLASPHNRANNLVSKYHCRTGDTAVRVKGFQDPFLKCGSNRQRAEIKSVVSLPKLAYVSLTF